MKASVLINNFNSGELSPLIESRSDLTKYAAGCKTLQNAIPLVEGGAKKMPGTVFAGISANGGPLGTASTGKSRLVPFEFSTNQTAILEFFAGGIRFWINGGLVLAYSDWNPLTTYSIGDQVSLGYFVIMNSAYPSSGDKLVIQAPYGQPNAKSTLIGIGLNTSDNLAVSIIGTAPNQGIQILFANATSSKNSSINIQNAIQALVSLNTPSLNFVDLSAWEAYWLPTSTTPPITSSTYSDTMSQGYGLYESTANSNTGNFPFALVDWTPLAVPSPLVVQTPYLEADLFALDVSTQSADVLYIVHPSYPPASLNRFSDTNWTYTPLSLYGTTDVVKTGFSALGQPISAISKANPAVVTIASASSSNPFIDGQRIYINLCSGMVELNQGQFLVSAAGGSTGAYTFELLPLSASGTGPVGSLSGGGGPFNSNPSTGPYTTAGGTGTGLTVTLSLQQIYGGRYVINSIFVTNAGTGYTLGDTVHFTVAGQTIFAEVQSLQSSGLINSTNFLDYTGGGFAVAVDSLFAGAGNYPACATLYQERLFLAGPLNNPTQVNGSVQGDYPDFICDPNEEDYALQFTLVSQKVNPIRWLIGSTNALFLGTSGSVWVMDTTDGAALSQTDVNAAPQTTMGAGNVAPQLVNNGLIWVSRSTYIVRLMNFNFVTNQWEGPDLTRLNRDIMKGPTASTSGVVQTAFQSDPYFIFWAVRADGQLVGLTYERDDQVFAWFRIATDGIIESVACVSQDNSEDQVWVSVNRTVNGVSQRYIEYFASQGIFSDLANAFFVHSGLQWNGGSPVAITGVTRGAPCTVTAPSHGFLTNQFMRIQNVLGMTQINTDPDTAYQITVIDPNTFSLQGIDSTTWDAYTSGGIATRVTNTVTGLQYIQGKNAQAVGDGAIIWEGAIDPSGTATFPIYANLVTIGLSYDTIIEPMNPILGSPQATSKGQKQKVRRATFSLYESIGGQYGTDQDHLYDMAYGTGSKGLHPTLFTGNITRDLDGEWSDEDTISIVHSDPFPFTLRSVVPRIDVGND